MRTIKRLLAAGLAVATLVSVPAFAAETDGLEHFQPVAAYSDGLFTDLDPNGWYMENVETAYELGLMKGVGSGSFSPDGTISLGETIALAARVHSIYETGEASFTQGSPWYQVYVDYAARNGIFTGSAATDYGAPATRSQFAAILASALPEEALEPINTVDDGMIPDVPVGAANYDAIYLLYRAGVLTGSDGKGTYNPQTTIGRSSVAALVTRMVKPELRQSITLIYDGPEIPLSHHISSVSKNILTVGETVQIHVDYYPANTTVRTVTYTSSKPEVASVSSSGLITALSPGSTDITSQVGDHRYNLIIGVMSVEPEVETILLQNNLYLDEGEREALSYTVYPSSARNVPLTWTSSDPDVATVDSYGTVTGKSAGICTITVSSGSVSTTCQVTVEAAEEERPTGGGTFESEFTRFDDDCLTVNGAYILLLEERDVLFLADVGTLPRNVSYTLSDPSVLSLTEDPSGLNAGFRVTPKEPGTCTVTASTGEDTCTVEIVVVDTTVEVEGCTHSYASAGRITYNGFDETSPVKIMHLFLRDYNSSYTTYELYVSISSDAAPRSLVMDTGSGEEVIGTLRGLTQGDTFTFQVPRGAAVTLRVE